MWSHQHTKYNSRCTAASILDQYLEFSGFSVLVILFSKELSLTGGKFSTEYLSMFTGHLETRFMK